MKKMNISKKAAVVCCKPVAGDRVDSALDCHARGLPFESAILPQLKHACLLLPSATKLRRLCFYTCLSVILFTGGGVCLSACWDATATPWDQPPGTRHPPPRPGTSQTRHPRGEDPPSRRLLLRTVRILLEYILVFTVLVPSKRAIYE